MYTEQSCEGCLGQEHGAVLLRIVRQDACMVGLHFYTQLMLGDYLQHICTRSCTIILDMRVHVLKRSLKRTPRWCQVSMFGWIICMHTILHYIIII